MKKGNKKLIISLISTIIILSLSFVLLIPNILLAATSTTDTTTETTIKITPELKFDVTYPELKATAGQSFAFQFTLTYIGDKEAVINLSAIAQDGWSVSITTPSQAGEISAVKLTPGTPETFTATATALVKQDPGGYDITVKAANNDLKINAELKLKAIITSTYDLSLTSKTGMLNTKATSGKDNNFILVLQNTASASIDNITFKADAPEKWVVKFNPEKIETLKSDESKDINVTITPPAKTIAGDYMLTLSVSSQNSNKSIDIRVTDETPSIWGWTGIGIIVIVIIGVAIIFARLGRR